MKTNALKLPYLQKDTDRHGKERLYFRMRGKPKVRLFGDPDSDRFREVYWRLRKGLEANDPTVLSPRSRDGYAVQTENAAERAFECAKKRSYARKISFNLDVEDALGVLRKQDHKCAVSGLKFQFSRPDGAIGGRTPYAPSLDRIDNAKGYEIGNVRWVLQAVNIALADWGDAQLIEIARAIVAKHPVPFLSG